MSVPSIAELQKLISQQTPSVPHMEWGNFSTPDTKVYRVTFKTPFLKSPSVICVGSARTGTLTPPKYTAPKITLPTVPTFAKIILPTVKLPTAATIQIPTVDLPVLPEIKVPTFSIQHVQTSLGRFYGGWAVQSLIDALNKLMEILEKSMGFINDAIDAVNTGFSDARKAIVNAVDSLKQFRDKIQDSLNKYRGYIQDSINTGLADTRDKMQTVLDTFNANVQATMDAYSANLNTMMINYHDTLQASINSVNTQIQDSINSSFSAIYKMLGVPAGVLATPVALNSVVPAYFDIIGVPKANFWWFAIEAT